jgi:hypothetical protein
LHPLVEALKKDGITLRARLTRPRLCSRGSVHDPDRARLATPGTRICRDQPGWQRSGPLLRAPAREKRGGSDLLRAFRTALHCPQEGGRAAAVIVIIATHH